MLKRFILAGLLVCLVLVNPFATHAQRKVVMNKPKYDLEPYHFGFILAANMMNLSWKPIDDYQNIQFGQTDCPDLKSLSSSYHVIAICANPIPGFAVGIVGNLRLGNHLDLRFIPTLSFGDRNIGYKIKTISNDTLDVNKNIQTNMVELPLELKFRSKRLNNFAAYLLTGAKYSIDMASTKKVQSAQNIIVKLDRHDVAIQAGVGFDFYTPFFKFGTELKMSYGLRNILVRDQYMYSQVLDRLNNKMMQISFTFE